MKKLRRNTKPANEARTLKADRLAVDVYMALKPLIDADAPLETMCYYLLNRTDLQPPRRGIKWRPVQVKRILERVKDRNLCL